MDLTRLLRALRSPRALAAMLVTSLAFASVSQAALAVGGTTGSITGTITDASTKTGLAGVTVAAVSPIENVSTTTDARGFFSLNGLPVDTYTLSFQLKGFEPQSVTGVTVQGDQTVQVDQRLSKSLTTIGRVSARSASAAFQPKQTTDSYQISGTTLNTALGRRFNISQTQLQTSVPGIQTTVYGSTSIRGGTRTEIAYQYEGVNYTEPFTNQFVNSLGLNGVASLQVNPGAGDASQGNAGTGAINLVSKRGSYPAFGDIDLEANAYPFSHQLGFDYGFATPNGRLSNYTSFIGQNQQRVYGLNGQAAVLQGRFFSTQAVVTRDIVNNLVLKLGKNQQNSLQFFYQNRVANFVNNDGGVQGLTYKTGDPNLAGQNSSAAFFNITSKTDPAGAALTRLADFQSIVPLLNGQTSPTQVLPGQGGQIQPVDFLKLEYDQTPDSKTYWSNRLYRVVSNDYFNTPYGSTSPISSGISTTQGGYRTGLAGDFQHQLNDKNLTTLSYLYETSQPTYDSVNNLEAYRSLAPGVQNGNGGYELPDFLGAGAVCPATDPNGTTLATVAATGNGCGYLQQYAGRLGSGFRIPNLIFASPGNLQNYGFGLRDQITASSALKIDAGVRYDAANYHLKNASNTPFKFGDDIVHPGVVQPRLAAALQLSRNDAIRASFGRSVEFTPGGLINSPVVIDGAYYTIPSRDSRTGLPATYCGPLNKSTCTSYGQQLHDEYVATAGPEANPVKPATYTNYDFSYEHQFGGNVSFKLTPFYKRGYDVNIFAQPVIGTDPVSNLPLFGPSVLTNLGIDKSTGVEFLLSRDVAYGFGGFLNFTYVNRLQNIPPGYLGQTEDFYPSAPPQSLALGSLFRAGYLSPLTGRLGLQYRSHNGFKINPIVSYDKGFPIGAGLYTSAYVNGVPTVVSNTNVSIPGFGPVSNSGASSGVGQYVDPVNPGSIQRPVVAATRGTAENASPGGVLSRARFNTDLALEYSAPGSRSTFGIYAANLFDQIYAEPGLNSRFQPVANGVAGPLTGQTSLVGSLGASAAGSLGFANYGTERFGSSAYNLTPSNAPLSVRFYYQLAL